MREISLLKISDIEIFINIVNFYLFWNRFELCLWCTFVHRFEVFGKFNGRQQTMSVEQIFVLQLQKESSLSK